MAFMIRDDLAGDALIHHGKRLTEEEIKGYMTDEQTGKLSNDEADASFALAVKRRIIEKAAVRETDKEGNSVFEYDFPENITDEEREKTVQAEQKVAEKSKESSTTPPETQIASGGAQVAAQEDKSKGPVMLLLTIQKLSPDNTLLERDMIVDALVENRQTMGWSKKEARTKAGVLVNNNVTNKKLTKTATGMIKITVKGLDYLKEKLAENPEYANLASASVKRTAEKKKRSKPSTGKSVNIEAKAEEFPQVVKNLMPEYDDGEVPSGAIKEALGLADAAPYVWNSVRDAAFKKNKGLSQHDKGPRTRYSISEAKNVPKQNSQGSEEGEGSRQYVPNKKAEKPHFPGARVVGAGEVLISGVNIDVLLDEDFKPLVVARQGIISADSLDECTIAFRITSRENPDESAEVDLIFGGEDSIPGNYHTPEGVVLKERPVE